MIHRVRAVHGMASSKIVLSLFDDTEMYAYVTGLDPKYTPPHCLERIRLLEAKMDGAMLELVRINDVSRMSLLHDFLP